MSAEAGRAPRGLFAAAGIIAIITLAARVIGFGRWFAFSHSVGATCVGTVYQSVNSVPNVFYEIAAGGVLAAIVVPLVAAALGRGDRAEADRTASALLTWTIVGLLPLALLVILAAEPLAELLLGPGCPGQLALGTQMLQIFAIQIPLYGVGIVLGGVLQARRRFVAAALAPLLSSVVVIATYLLYGAMVDDPAAPIAEIPADATAALAVGTTLGVVALSLPLLIPLARAGIRLHPTFRFAPGTATRVRRLALAGLLAVVGQQVAILFVIRLANDHGGPGALNIYTYAQAITLLPYAVLAVPLATAAFPDLATGAEHESRSGQAPVEAVATLNRTWQATLVAGLFGSALVVALARPVDVFFARLDAGATASETSLGMTQALVLYAPAVLGLSVIALLSRASYVRGRARVAGLVVATGWLGTAAIPALLLGWDSDVSEGPNPATTVSALSAGASIGLGLAAIALVVLVQRAWGSAALRVHARPMAAVLLGGTSAALTGWFLSRALPLDTASLVGLVGWGLLVALVAIAVGAAVTLVIDPKARDLLKPKARRVSRPSDPKEAQ